MNTWIWYLLVYSFLGYLLEVAYAKIVHGRGSGRKCLLLLPLCPVYGGGRGHCGPQRSQSSALVGDGGGLRGGHGGGAAVWTLL